MRYQNSDNGKTNTATVAICRDWACLGLRSVEHATWRALDAAEVYRAGQGLPFIGFSFHPQLRVVGSCLLFFRASLLFSFLPRFSRSRRNYHIFHYPVSFLFPFLRISRKDIMLWSWSMVGTFLGPPNESTKIDQHPM